MRFGSVCSGIEAASVAWNPLGWKAQWLSEIEPFPCSLLAHHYPNTPNLGDMTKFESWPTDDKHAIDLLCGGTPCQSFSVAGLRKGLDDPRGNLMLTFGAIAAKYRPKWLVWENVPGVLSSNGGRDFGSFLGMLGQLGYGFAYRVLDAQYFGVAQRRRRVFVVGCFGDWRGASAVLFERYSLQGHPTPRRQAGKGSSHSLTASLTASSRGAKRNGETKYQDHVAAVPSVAGTMMACKDSGGWSNSVDHAAAGYMIPVAVAFPWQSALDPIGKPDNISGTLIKNQIMGCMDESMKVRRLTPCECERLQGFPDDYTLVPNRGKPAADGPRYKALGNSWAVPNVRWIGSRIEEISKLSSSQSLPNANI